MFSRSTVFRYGQFHGDRVKEQVYLPDWTSPERLAYTNLLFDLLAKLLPAGVEGSVSTLPGSFKGFHLHADALKAIRQNLWHCVEHIAHLSEQTGRKLHLGLEPEPLCLLESSAETIQLFDRLRTEHPRDPRLAEHLGVNYDTCHFAVNFEEPQNALPCLVPSWHQNQQDSPQLGAQGPAHGGSPPGARRRLPTMFICIRWSCATRTGNRNIYYDLPEALADPEPGARTRPEFCPNGGFISTFHCTPPPHRRLKPRTIICSRCWICWRKTRSSARIWKWKPTPGKYCRRN